MNLITRSLLTAALLGLIPTGASAAPLVPHPRQAARILRVGEELVEWLHSVGRATARSPAVAEEVESSLVQVLRRGEDISPEVSALLRRDLHLVEKTGVLDARLLRLLSAHPQLCAPAWGVTVRLGLRDMEPRIAKLAAEMGDGAPKLLNALATSVPEEDAISFMRGLAGKSLSRKSAARVADALEATELSSVDKGQAWECLSRSLLSRGSNKSAAGLRDGGEVVRGQFNGVHGIDGVGAASDGRPVIFEFSMYRNKVLGETTDGIQLSPEWTAQRWNLAIQDPQCVAEFRRAGVGEQYLKAVTAAEAKSWPRKLVVAHESALTSANRLSAEIGPNDLFALGGD